MKKNTIFKTYIFNLLLTTVFGGVIGLINYLFNIFLARFSTEDIFALYSTAIGVIYLIQIPATSIQNILTKSVGEQKEGDLKRLKITSILSFSILAVILGTLFFFLTPLITDPSYFSNELILPLTVTLVLAFISTIHRGILLGKEKIVLVNLILLGETILKFAIGYIGIRMGENIHLLILANAVPSFLSFLITIPFIKSAKNYRKKITIPYKNLTLMTISLLLLSIPYTLDLILTPETLKAEYGTLSLIGKLVYFACITIAFAMFSKLSNQKELKKKLKTLGITLAVTLVIGIAVTVGVYIFKDQIINLAFGGKYSDISIYFVIFGLFMSSYSVVYMLANFFFSRNSYWYILILVITAILQITLFTQNCNSLFDIVKNQGIVYCTLLISTIIYFIFNFAVKKDGEKDKEGS